MADEPRPTNLPITATDVEHQFWTEQLEPSGQPRTSELLEEVPSFSYKDRVVSVSRKDLDALGNYLLQYGESEGLSSIPPRIRNEWTGSGKKWHEDLWDRSENVPPNYPLVPTEKKTGKKVARIPPKVRGGIMRALRNVPGHVGLGLKAYEAATAAWDLLSKPQQDKLIRLVYPPLPKEGGIADLPMGEEESLFQKPSDLIHQAQEPTVEDIRRVLAEHTDLLMGPSLPVTENRMRMFEAARRKHGPESTRWGENWEEAGRELGFETDAELRTLINDIYDVEERGPFVPGMPKDDPRYEFWALEGPAFERTVQNILEKRSERESYIPDEVISLLHTGAKQNREPGEFIGTLIERGLVPETARDAANKHFEDGIWLREQGGEGGITSLPMDEESRMSQVDVIEGGAPTLKPLEEVSQSTLKRRLKNKKKELSDIIGMPIKRGITLRHEKKINEVLEGADDLTTAKINKLVDDVYLLKERINPDTRFGPSYRTHPDMEPEGSPSPKNTIVEIMGELDLTEALGPVKSRSGVIQQGTEGIMQRLWEMSPDDIKMTDAILKQKFNKGILEFEFPENPDPNMLRVITDHYGTPSMVKEKIESILEPSPQGPHIVKARGGFIDKPLYDRAV